jgi:peroxiredoxin
LKEAPSLEKLYGQYQSRGLVVFRVDTKESRETINNFLAKRPSTIPILLDEKNKVGKLLGLWVHPTSYLVDAKGIIRYRVVGTAEWTGVEGLSIIDRLLGER